MARLPHIVDSPSPTEGQVLAYDSTAKKWKPVAPTAHSHTITNVTGLQDALSALTAKFGNITSLNYGPTLPETGTEGDIFFLEM